MKLESVCVTPDDIGWHGIGPAEVTETTTNHAEIDLGTWVDEDGIGESTTGTPVKKQFPATVVLLDNPELDHTDCKRYADNAYIGTNGSHHNDTYIAKFDNTPPCGQFSTFFPHDIRTVPTPANATSTKALADYDLHEVRDKLLES